MSFLQRDGAAPVPAKVDTRPNGEAQPQQQEQGSDEEARFSCRQETIAEQTCVKHRYSHQRETEAHQGQVNQSAEARLPPFVLLNAPGSDPPVDPERYPDHQKEPRM